MCEKFRIQPLLAGKSPGNRLQQAGIDARNGAIDPGIRIARCHRRYERVGSHVGPATRVANDRSRVPSNQRI